MIRVRKCKIVTTVMCIILLLSLSCSSKKYHTGNLNKSHSSPSKDDNNYHLKTANKIVDETSSHSARRERKAERKRNRYNRSKEKQEAQEKKQKSARRNTYKDKKSSGTVPLY